MSGTIGMNLGTWFVPCNLSNYWGADIDRRNMMRRWAIRDAQDKLTAKIEQADLMTRFSAMVMRKLEQEGLALQKIRSSRQLTKQEEEQLDLVITLFRKYRARYEYHRSKLDFSSVIAVHDLVYDEDVDALFDWDTEQYLNPDTGEFYKLDGHPQFGFAAN